MRQTVVVGALLGGEWDRKMEGRAGGMINLRIVEAIQMRHALTHEVIHRLRRDRGGQRIWLTVLVK